MWCVLWSNGVFWMYIGGILPSLEPPVGWMPWAQLALDSASISEENGGQKPHQQMEIAVVATEIAAAAIV